MTFNNRTNKNKLMVLFPEIRNVFLILREILKSLFPSAIFNEVQGAPSTRGLWQS